jgi:uncharacterized membrane protein
MIPSSHFHPMSVHFPIALVMLGFTAEIASLFIKKETAFSKFGFYLLIIGTIAALFASLTGIFFTSEMSGPAGEMKESHEQFARIALILLIATSTFRIILKTKNKESSGLKWLAFTLYALAVISLGITGFYGGTLVYNYMMLQ